jgi:hypothetical protein
MEDQQMADATLKIGERGYVRQQRLAQLRAAKVPGIRVFPRDEKVRAGIRHPNGVGFRSTGSVEWPNDKFTRKRIADGTVTVEDQASSGANKPSHRPPHRPSSEA